MGRITKEMLRNAFDQGRAIGKAQGIADGKQEVEQSLKTKRELDRLEALKAMAHALRTMTYATMRALEIIGR